MAETVCMRPRWQKYLMLPVWLWSLRGTPHRLFDKLRAWWLICKI
jgi:hypothetical protein